MKKLLGLLTLLILSPFFLFAVEEGEQAPAFVNPNLRARHTFSRDILGQGWVVLDFFATDCIPCQMELPELEQLYEEFREQGFRVIVFATDQAGASVVKPYFENRPTPLTVLLDRYRVTTEKYQVKDIPTVFLVDPEGKVAIKGAGYSEEVIQEMRETLKKALAAE